LIGKYENIKKEYKENINKNNEKIKRNENEYQKMLKFRKSLPSFQKKDEIFEIIKNNQIIIIYGFSKTIKKKKKGKN
jgi:HrpA-like RNA helicase